MALQRQLQKERQPKNQPKNRRKKTHENLLKEAKTLSGVRTKKEAIEIALEEFARREKLKILVELEGKMERLQHQEARHDPIPCFNN